MAKPSLQASGTGQQLAEQSLKLMGVTKQSLSKAVGCSRQPVTNFFKGVAIEQGLFVRLCDYLKLDWQTVAGLTPKESPSMTGMTAGLIGGVIAPSENAVSTAPNLDKLVQSLQAAAKDSLYERCGTMRVLDMSHPVGLGNIYTSVNVLAEVSSHQRLPLSKLIDQADIENFDRLGFGRIMQSHQSAAEVVSQHQKLIVLGKPGAGKTTFLKHLAIECIEGRFEPKRLPLFINLKQFAEDPYQLDLLSFLSQRHFKSQLSALSAADVEQSLQQLKQVLNAGRALLLLDGLDEVSQTNQDRVLREIRLLSEEFHANQFLMTCRVAAWEYTFEQFTEVEIADFDLDQIKTFAYQWMKDKPASSADFMQRLANQPRLAELATTPLLLTLLCLSFESTGSLPSSRSELYQEGTETLLKKWDASRGIHRDQIYKGLSVRRKEDLLSHIALTTFKQNQVFFRQRDLVEYLITDYICNLPEASEDPQVLQVDSAAVLNSIEAQHGLLVERAKHCYSFSHLTFQEYFAARELVFNSDSLKDSMAMMVEHYALDRRWREVFLLVSELLRNADLLLSPLADLLHSLLAGSSKLQTFLAEVVEQSRQAQFEGIRPSAVRAFLFDIDFDIDQNRWAAVRLDRAANLLVCASFVTRTLADVGLKEAITLVKDYDQQIEASQTESSRSKIAQTESANEAMKIALTDIVLASQKLGPAESQQLQPIAQQLHQSPTEPETIQEVADAARQIAKNKRHIGKKWTFNSSEKQQLKQYYWVAWLLADCLRSDGCTLEPSRRQAIENSLFSPVSTF